MAYSKLPLALNTIRAGYGLALLTAPRHMLAGAADATDDAPARAVTRLLGARQLIQAAVAHRAGPLLLAAGALVDTSHALTVAVLASIDARHERLALASGAIASGLAIEGAVASVAAARRG